MSLSPIQIQVARLVANELNGSDFALVGGAVLIEAGVVNRTTNDLDFFGSGSMLPSECEEGRASAPQGDVGS